MIRFYFSFFFVITALYTSGQEFSTSVYFEDANGNMDTLVFGYDANATDSIDPSFGEFNIKSTPFGSSFEARITDYDFTLFGQYISDPTSYHIKMQIKQKDCISILFPHVSAISLSNCNFPLKVSWDSSQFSNSCRIKSLITDWHPGGWFDAVFGGEQGPHYFNTMDSVSFTHTTMHYLNSANDTIDVLFLTIASGNNVIAGVNASDLRNGISIYPNPTSDLAYIKIDDPNFKIENVKLYSISGKEFKIDSENTSIDLESLPAGVYILQLEYSNRPTSFHRVVKCY